MRVWDISPWLLCRNHLLGEHREIHYIWKILTEGGKKKTSYANHPEVKRWRGEEMQLFIRHYFVALEMRRRGYSHRSNLDISSFNDNSLGSVEFFGDNTAPLPASYYMANDLMGQIAALQNNIKDQVELLINKNKENCSAGFKCMAVDYKFRLNEDFWKWIKFIFNEKSICFKMFIEHCGKFAVVDYATQSIEDGNLYPTTKIDIRISDRHDGVTYYRNTKDNTPIDTCYLTPLYLDDCFFDYFYNFDYTSVMKDSISDPIYLIAQEMKRISHQYRDDIGVYIKNKHVENVHSMYQYSDRYIGPVSSRFMGEYPV